MGNPLPQIPPYDECDGHDIPTFIGVDKSQPHPRKSESCSRVHAHGHRRAWPIWPDGNATSRHTVPMMTGWGPMARLKWAACSQLSKCGKASRLEITGFPAGTRTLRVPSHTNGLASFRADLRARYTDNKPRLSQCSMADKTVRECNNHEQKKDKCMKYTITGRPQPSYFSRGRDGWRNSFRWP